MPYTSPPATLEELRSRCPAQRHLNVLRVPKAGSTSFTEMIGTACGKRDDPSRAWQLTTLHAHEARPADTCDGASVTTLRDPCERLVSMYRHFEILWGLKLRSHWVKDGEPLRDSLAHPCSPVAIWPTSFRIPSLSATLTSNPRSLLRSIQCRRLRHAAPLPLARDPRQQDAADAQQQRGHPARLLDLSGEA